MEIKIPKQIKIAGRTYTIKFSKNIIRDDGDRGTVCYGTQIIELYDRLEKEQLAVTFLHEYIHAVEQHLCGREIISEATTCGLSEGIYQLLDNFGIEFSWEDIK